MKHPFIYGLCALIASSTTIASCKKDEEKPQAPVITYGSISTNQVVQFDNTISLTFDYEDYQGDLGETDPDNYSLRIRDARLADYDWYHIPPMTPNNEELHIKGTYVLELNSLFLLSTGTQETTTLELQIKDRAGNWSNIITTPVITILDSL